MDRGTVPRRDRIARPTRSASTQRRAFVGHVLAFASIVALPSFAASSRRPARPEEPLGFGELQALARAVASARRAIDLERIVAADPRFRNRLEIPRPVSEHGVIFATPVSAALLCRAFGWSRPYGVAVDVHQQSWRIELWRADLVDPYGTRIATGTPRLGSWAVEARLTMRPGGPLPGVSAGASPAYDLLTAPADAAALEIRAWDDDIDR